MALDYGFFDSDSVTVSPSGLVVGNNAKNAAFFAQYFASIISSGVFEEEDGSGFLASAQSGMNVTVAPGKAFLRGYLCFDTESWTSSFASDTSAHTYYFLIRLDLATNKIERKWLCDPDMSLFPVRNGSYYDLIPAVLTVPANATALTPDMLSDKRADPLLCGYARSTKSAGCAKSDTWTTPRGIRLTGAVSAPEVSFDGSGDVTIEAESVSVAEATGVLPIENGGTGASDAARARSYLGCAAASHTHSASAVSGTFASAVYASVGADYTTSRLRNISILQTAPTSVINGSFAAVI